MILALQVIIVIAAIVLGARLGSIGIGLAGGLGVLLLGLTGTEQALLPTLGVGQGLWKIKGSSYVVQHQLHPAENRLFDTSSRAAARS